MSWARIDDGLWEHEKFEALRFAGEHAAGFLWLLAISHCGAKLNPKITLPEAQMLLACDEATAKQACEVLRSTGLFDPDSASKHTPSYLIHNWKHYRSKNEAKVLAGRKGGKKSGESRRSKGEANGKQSRSKRQAEPKQTRSPDSDPAPDSDTDSDPAPGLAEGGSDPMTQTVQVEAAGFKRYGSLVGNGIPAIRNLLPIYREEFADAMKSNGRSWVYVARVIESARVEKARGPGPPAEERLVIPGAPNYNPDWQMSDYSREEQAVINAYFIEKRDRELAEKTEGDDG
jgi:hypothetical protein